MATDPGEAGAGGLGVMGYGIFGDDAGWAELAAQAEVADAVAREEARHLTATAPDPWAAVPTALRSADLYHLLRVGRSTLHDALRRGDIPSPTLRLGAQGRLLWARAVVQRWLDGSDRPAAVDGHLVLTLEEAAEHLGCGRSTGYELARTGHLRAVRIGRLLRLPVSAVAALRREWVEEVPGGDRTQVPGCHADRMRRG
jgi:excisionase family DNA binding protein